VHVRRFAVQIFEALTTASEAPSSTQPCTR